VYPTTTWCTIPFNSFSLTELAEMQYFFLTLSLRELAEILRSHTQNPPQQQTDKHKMIAFHCIAGIAGSGNSAAAGGGGGGGGGGGVNWHPPAHPGWCLDHAEKHFFIVNSCSVTLNHGGWFAMD
jgi:hypothetical protein